MFYDGYLSDVRPTDVSNLDDLFGTEVDLPNFTPEINRFNPALIGSTATSGLSWTLQADIEECPTVPPRGCQWIHRGMT